MTSIFASEKIQNDYQFFEEELRKDISVAVPFDDPLICLLKKYHKLTYALALFPLKLKDVTSDKNKYLFLFEIQSDLLNALSLLILGFNYPAKMLFRRVIENFYNHVYYLDHPVEFTQLNLGKNEYNPMIEMKNYFITHPRLLNCEDENIKLFSDKVFNKYVELNKIVHTKGVLFMGLSKNLQEIRFASDYLEFIESCNDTLISIVYLLYKFHSELVFSSVETRLIVDCIPKDKRLKLTE